MFSHHFSSFLELSMKSQSGGSLSQHLSKIDPDFYEYLRESDSGLLEEMAPDSTSEDNLSDGEAELKQIDQSSSDDDDNDLGTVEPRPLHITSRKEVSNQCLITP